MLKKLKKFLKNLKEQNAQINKHITNYSLLERYVAISLIVTIIIKNSSVFYFAYYAELLSVIYFMFFCALIYRLMLNITELYLAVCITKEIPFSIVLMIPLGKVVVKGCAACLAGIGAIDAVDSVSLKVTNYSPLRDVGHLYRNEIDQVKFYENLRHWKHLHKPDDK
jgi:hypothetical protein